jgi:DNA-binding NtrC family response regulator
MRNNIETTAGRLPRTVIVAEKDPISRTALAAMLSYDGYRVLQADSVSAVISQMNSIGHIGVLLADLDMVGWRSLIRHVVQTTDALVIGLEGNVRFSKMYDLKQHGIRACLQKPFIYEDVRTAIMGNSESVHDEALHRKAA